MTVNKIDNGALQYHAPDGVFLGIPTGISTRRFSSADTVAIRKSEGIIISGAGEISSWPIERFIEFEGDMIALGPWLEESKPFEKEDFTPEMIARLLPAIRLLKSAGFPMNGLYSKAVRWLSDGGILIYPPKLVAWMVELNQDSRMWIHPDRKGDSAWSFSLGVLAWQVLTGSDPFAGETDEARRERIRLGILPPLESLAPGVTQNAEILIRKALTGPEETAPTLEDWGSFIKLWLHEGIVSALPETELQERKARARDKADGIEKKLRNRRWFRKSGWKLLVSVAVIAGVLAFISAPIRKALEAPVTAGMPPMEVAETYYRAIDDMDSEIMDDCLAKKIGKDDVRLITTVYVTSKMRQGYEGIGDPPLASDWIKDGKPELSEGIWPWGISDLTLKQLNDGRIEARYRFWTPPEGGTEGGAASWSVSRIDILHFTQGRKSWEISGIQRTTEE